MKRVFYNGHTESYSSCQPASDLRAGHCYEVLEEIVFPYQTNYVLKGLSSKSNRIDEAGYNSAWFKEVTVYLANSMHYPEVGEPLRNFYRQMDNGRWEIIEHTSKVLEIHPLGEDVFEVYTVNSTYILKVFRK